MRGRSVKCARFYEHERGKDLLVQRRVKLSCILKDGDLPDGWAWGDLFTTSTHSEFIFNRIKMKEPSFINGIFGHQDAIKRKREETE